MKIVTALCKSILYSFAKNCYWLYNALRIQTRRGLQISFPFIVEGRGKISFGENIIVNKGVALGCAKESTMIFGAQTKLCKEVRIYTSENVNFKFGKHSVIEEYTRCLVKDDWHIGNNVVIATNCQFFSREKDYKGKLVIGDRTYIGDYSLVDISADIKIGKDVAIGPHCTIYTHDHDYTENDLVPWKGKAITKPVQIEDGVWVGANVTILPGVIIGKKSIVAAGSVVTKKVPPDVITAGVPAKVIRQLTL